MSWILIHRQDQGVQNNNEHDKSLESGVYCDKVAYFDYRGLVVLLVWGLRDLFHGFEEPLKHGGIILLPLFRFFHAHIVLQDKLN
jgi:hypothetical protein